MKSNDTKLVVFVLFPELGAYNSSLIIAGKLAEAGYEVVYITNAKFEPYIRSQGFSAVVISLDEVYGRFTRLQRRRFGEGPRPVKFFHTMVVKSRLNRSIESFLIAQVDGAFGARTPDVVLLDPLMFNYSIPFLRKGVPLISLSTTLANVLNTALPPVFSAGVPGGPAWAGRLKNLWTWLALAANICRKDYQWHCRHGALPTRTLNSTNKIIKKYGAKITWGEYGYKLKVPELVMACDKIDFPHYRRDPRRTYIGPCVYVGRNDGEAFDWTTVDARLPIIYCSLGTYSANCRESLRLFEAVVTAIRARPEWQLILQSGDAVGPGHFGPLPANIIVRKRVPQLEVLARAAVNITHGGFNSVKESVYFGVPMIVFPWSNDGWGNAARVEYHRIGLRADIRTIDAAGMNALINEIDANRVYRTSVKQMQEAFLAEADGRLLVQLIHRYAGRPQAYNPETAAVSVTGPVG